MRSPEQAGAAAPTTSRAATLAGLAVAGVGIAHFTSPQLFDTVNRRVFPRNSDRHMRINGGIDTALGLGLCVRRTRPFAAVAALGYIAYLTSNVVRRQR